MKVLGLVLAASLASALPHGPDDAMPMAPAKSTTTPVAPAKPSGTPAASVIASPKPVAQIGSGTEKTKTPAGCNRIASDTDWPAEAEWKKALPDIVARSKTLAAGIYRPDYSIRAESYKDVQDAVKFAAKNNIRLTVINSGHDFVGRNDAPTGLSLDVSLLKGIKVLESFEPTTKGAEKPGKTANVITPLPGKQAAVTIGVAVMAQELHNQLSKSKLTSIGAAHGSVAPAGGFGQTAGHAPLSNRYGLGADQFLELKVVTADGELKIANKNSNPDLFWALRGGGGSTYGVVVEATVKAHPDIPITTSVFFVNTTKPNSDGLWQSYAYLHTRFVDLIENHGTSGYFYIYPDSIKGVFLHQAEHSGTDNAKKIFEPILLKMSEFPDMKKASLDIKEYSNYKGYFDARFGAARGDKMMTKRGVDLWEVEAEDETARFLSLERRHGPGDMDMAKPPVPSAISGLDSRLLGDAEFKHPNLTAYLKAAAPFALGAASGVLQGHLVGGGKVLKPDDDTSVNPAWRKAYVHTIGYKVADKVSVDSLRALAPASGAYANEAYFGEPNWKQSFWGSNYEKLSQLKTKYDPNMVFWVSPGINADHMEVRENRVCKVTGAIKNLSTAPLSDNLNRGRIQRGTIN